MAKSRRYRKKARRSRRVRPSRKTRPKRRIRRSSRSTAGMFSFSNVKVPINEIIKDLNIAFPYDQDIKSLFPKREDYNDFITDVAIANAQHYTISNYMSYGKKEMITETKEDLEQLTREYKEYIEEVKKGLMKKKEIPEPVIGHILKMVPPL